ncbi:hypothetical protein GCM10010145_61900 [Streptomyces ruber]|uniref:Uncharacterized protein n=2 Tax=Streptomyces TaxID=1883 RepID=A0A918BPV7_9ACTN|nr:hypothetical protein GCM10010145_61900 [Streptomyces ruber]
MARTYLPASLTDLGRPSGSPTSSQSTRFKKVLALFRCNLSLVPLGEHPGSRLTSERPDGNRRRRNPTPMHTQVVLFDGFDPLDAIAPYEVLYAGGSATEAR